MSLRDLRHLYETQGLDRDDLLDDPVEQWNRWYAVAESGGIPEANAFALATLGTDDIPDARTLLARGFDARGLVFFTNYHSIKSSQLDEHPYAGAVFHWQALHRQVRLRGPVLRVDDAENDAYFASRPRESQIGAWASPQSEPVASRQELDQRVAELTAQFAGRPVPRPPFWGGWRLVPVSFEFWQGRAARLHDRFRYTRNDTDPNRWDITRLAP
jgi:pyridoxamine 5'-phosphate oxidase